MKYRLCEGSGVCTYEIGVLDSGVPEGLSPADMRETLDCIASMARTLGADVRVLQRARGLRGEVAEVEVREGNTSQRWTDVRVAVIGAEQSGKSSLVGSLCTGVPDNGRGSARMAVFRHRHEVESGYTSSLSSQLLGFTAAGEAVNLTPPASFTSPSWGRITDVASKLITFSDLVGHESGQKVTLPPLLHEAVDYALIVLSAERGLTAMDRECLAICDGLDIRYVLVIAKVDRVGEDRVAEVVEEVREGVKGVGKHVRFLRSRDDVKAWEASPTPPPIPVFALSSVTGLCVDVFSAFLAGLLPHKEWRAGLHLPAQFSIDSVYSIDDTSVVGGVVMQGSVYVSQPLLLGPVGREGAFYPVTCTSIHVKRRDVRRAEAGQTASLGLALPPPLTHSHLRRGLVLFEGEEGGKKGGVWGFEAEMTLSSPPDPLMLYYQPVLYMPNIRQSAMLLSVEARGVAGEGDGEGLRYGMKFQWCYFPEHVEVGYRVVLREGATRGVGRVVRVDGVGGEGERRGRVRGKSRGNAVERVVLDGSPSASPSAPSPAPAAVEGTTGLTHSVSLPALRPHVVVRRAGGDPPVLTLPLPAAVASPHGAVEEGSASSASSERSHIT